MLFKIIVSIVLIATPMITLSQTMENVEVRLATESGRTQFRIGEPIRLTLSFTSDASGYFVENISSKPGSSYEEILVSPSAGAFNWSKQFLRGRQHMECVRNRSKLSATPTVISLTLNDFIRFDTPGTYSISFRTKRVDDGDMNPTRELTTNDIRLTIAQMSEADEAAETKRLSAALDAANGNPKEQPRLAEHLSYLTGRPSSIEKVKRYLAGYTTGNSTGEIRFGLFIARDRKLVSELLQAAFRDLSRDVDFELFTTLASIRSLAAISDDTPYSDADHAQVENELIAELAESLSRRKGISRGAAAITILQKLPRDNPPAALLARVRSILLADFDTYNPFSREYLLGTYWEWLKDPSLVPSLERMLTDSSYPDYGRVNIQTTAIKSLIELDPQKARPHVIALIKNPDTMLFDDALDGLPDRSLPEIDSSVVDQIAKFAAARDSVRLRSRALFVTRYATAEPYYPLLELYQRFSGSWEYGDKGILLGYFLKHNPAEGTQMLKEEAGRIDRRMRSSLFNYATQYVFPSETAEYLEAELMQDDPITAGGAAYILSKRGDVKHRGLIQKRLDKWFAVWGSRVKELEGPNLAVANRDHAMLLVELISALTTSRQWRLSATEIRELRSRCVIEACRPYVREESTP